MAEHYPWVQAKYLEEQIIRNDPCHRANRLQMEHKTNNIENSDSLVVCCVECSCYGTGDNMVCVRQSDGSAIPLQQSEVQLLSRMSTPKTVGDSLETLCKDAIEERLQDG